MNSAIGPGFRIYRNIIWIILFIGGMVALQILNSERMVEKVFLGVAGGGLIWLWIIWGKRNPKSHKILITAKTIEFTDFEIVDVQFPNFNSQPGINLRKLSKGEYFKYIQEIPSKEFQNENSQKRFETLRTLFKRYPLIIPINDLTEVWQYKTEKGIFYVALGTGYYDILIKEENYRKGQLWSFFNTHLPKNLLQPSSKYNSIVYLSLQNRAKDLLAEQKKYVSVIPAPKLYWPILILITGFLLFLIINSIFTAGLIPSTRDFAIMVILLAGGFIYHGINNIGRKKLTVYEHKIIYQFKNKAYELSWDEVIDYFINGKTSPNRKLLRNFSYEFFKQNELFYVMASSRYHEKGYLIRHQNPIIFDDSQRFNKIN